MIDPELDRRFPSVAYLERRALRRMPRFMADYVRCGMGRGGCVRRNRDDLDKVELMPRYSRSVPEVDTRIELCGLHFAAPFGVAPVGLGSLAWPRAPAALAAAARRHQLPFVGSTVALAGLEALREQGGESAWLGLYRPNVPQVEEDLLQRAQDAGYETMVVTVDVPANTRRDHDIHNSFALPPALTLRTVLDLMAHPSWSFAVGRETVRSGFPRFDSLERYLTDVTTAARLRQMSGLIKGYVDVDAVARLRQLWPGRLLVKGVLDVDDALRYRDAGADGIVVSNHGGRQFEAAPSAASVLPDIRTAVGDDYPLLADGGVRSGLDICRMLALGANFVLLGRPFYYAVAALGAVGADHVMSVLKAELYCTLGQLGCASVTELAERVRRA
ncbi:MAG: alpha-hydroxy-acid oxidizing enzyme [Thiotrichales bacterium]|nr:alpha-hydroxy-acid oxidizing enzyme [Thiotrichales bacterium]